MGQALPAGGLVSRRTEPLLGFGAIAYQAATQLMGLLRPFCNQLIAAGAFACAAVGLREAAAAAEAANLDISSTYSVGAPLAPAALLPRGATP